MNKLLREQKMQRSCSERLEVLVKQKVKRRIGKPPEDALTLREVVDIIFHLDAEWHKRARGKTSQFHTDLEALCKHINGCVLADEMIHWCWEEEAATACHRCAADVTDESIECCHNACFGTADPEPAESRWTHVLPNMHARHVAAIVHAAAAAATSQRGSSGGSHAPDLGLFEVVQLRHVA